MGRRGGVGQGENRRVRKESGGGTKKRGRVSERQSENEGGRRGKKILTSLLVYAYKNLYKSCYELTRNTCWGT